MAGAAPWLARPTELHSVKNATIALDEAIPGAAGGFASLDDLIRMKETAGRPKDLEGLRALRQLRERPVRGGMLRPSTD